MDEVKIEGGDHQLADQNPPKISGDSVSRYADHNEQDADGESYGILEETQTGMSQAIQDTGESAGEIQERTQEGQRADKCSGIFIAIDQSSQGFPEEEKDSGGKDAQKKTVFDRIFCGFLYFFVISQCLFSGDYGKKNR